MMTTSQQQATDLAIGVAGRQGAEEQNGRDQADFARLARLATMGEMAAGLAHELSQPLTAALGCTELLIENLGTKAMDPVDVRTELKEAAKHLERAAKVVHSIRSFVAGSKPQRSAINVNDAVRETTDLTKADFKWHGVTLGLELEDRLPPVWADAIQIEQVILNLVRNGIQAMAGPQADRAANPRSLIIRTSARRSDSGQVVEVAIRDTGQGLPEGAIDRLFDPFYSTKPDGMGIGLSLSRSIITAHGGRLWATANPDRGATFRFTLPASGQA